MYRKGSRGLTGSQKPLLSLPLWESGGRWRGGGGGQKAHVLDEWTGCHDANTFQDFIVLGVTCQLNVRPPERAEPIGT